MIQPINCKILQPSECSDQILFGCSICSNQILKSQLIITFRQMQSMHLFSSSSCSHMSQALNITIIISMFTDQVYGAMYLFTQAIRSSSIHESTSAHSLFRPLAIGSHIQRIIYTILTSSSQGFFSLIIGCSYAQPVCEIGLHQKALMVN